jgi:hypothetical protein
VMTVLENMAKIRPMRYGNLQSIFLTAHIVLHAKIRPVRYGNMLVVTLSDCGMAAS